MSTAIVHPGVHWAGDKSIGSFAVIGEPPARHAPGELETWIGAGATIRSHTIIYAGNRIGAGFQTGHGAMIRELNVIGERVSIGTASIVEHHVEIGDGARLHSRVFVPEYTVIEADAWLGPAVVLTNARYPQSPNVKAELKGAHIERHAILGANVTVLPGVRIGRGAIIGAGSVVTADVPTGAVMVGNPARRIKDRADLPYGTLPDDHS